MVVRKLPFIPADPLGCWPLLHPHPRHGFVLGSAAGTVRDHLVFMSAGEPKRTLTLPSPVSGRGDSILHSLSQFMGEGQGEGMPRFVGFFSFDCGRWFDPALARLPKRPNPLKTPLALFGDYRNVVKFDLQKKETVVTAENKKTLKRILDILNGRRGYSGSVPTLRESLRQNNPASRFHHKTEREFSVMVKKAKESIAAGDIYQANLSLRFEKKFSGSAFDLYRQLCEKNPSPYACLLKMGSQWIVSTSPELLVSVEGRTLKTRPIAGTRPRGKDAAEDRRKRGQLLLSPKERAEHIMLVDLERNDLGRVSTMGSVKVTDRFAVERYSHVMHIVSQVEGKLRPGRTALDAVKALFPGGTISGCPKYRSIEIIEKLEGISRGPFYGSAGYFGGNGDAVFNILIRTAVISGGRVAVQAGAGVVADSNPAREYRETLMKAQALLESIGKSMPKVI